METIFLKKFFSNPQIMHMSFYHVIITGIYIWAAILYYSLSSLETGAYSIIGQRVPSA